MITYMIMLVIKPFSFAKLACQLCFRAIALFAYESLQLVKFNCNLYIRLLWSVFSWSHAIITFPVRVLTALQREKQLEMRIYELQMQLDSSVVEKRRSEERLLTVSQDSKMMDTMLTELEEEHDKAISKIRILEKQVSDLKDENRRVRNLQKTLDASGFTGFESWSSALKGGDQILEDLKAQSRETICKTQHSKLNAADPKENYPPAYTKRAPEKASLLNVPDRHRGAALHQSLFSAFLAVLVAIITWEAGDPCMPLVVALFIVVGMSLKSVVQFFTTIGNRPAIDAVALLSFNWFILGMLAYPSLPSIGRLVMPYVVQTINNVPGWFGITSESEGA